MYGPFESADTVSKIVPSSARPCAVRQNRCNLCTETRGVACSPRKPLIGSYWFFARENCQKEGSKEATFAGAHDQLACLSSRFSSHALRVVSPFSFPSRLL